MYPVFETIKIVDGVPQHLSYHRQRMQRTAKALWNKNLNYEFLENEISHWRELGVWKCRVKYKMQHLSVEFLPYQITALKSLKIVDAPELNYPFKYTQRHALEKYTLAYSTFSDILFVKNGVLTDTLFANIALWNGTEWHTPSTPLLYGTMRARLLDEGLLTEQNLMIMDLKNYKKLSTINAMLDLEVRCIAINQISY